MVLVAYRVLWCAAAVLALASMALSYRAEVADQRASLAFYDLGLTATGTGTAGQTVEPFSPQAKRLFSGRETVLSINGRAVPSDNDGQTRVLSGSDGVSAAVELMRADGSRHRVVLRRSSDYLTDAYAGIGMTWATQRWIEFGVSTLAGLFWFAMSLLLFLRRPRDPVAAPIATGAILSNIALYTLWPSTPVLASACLWVIASSSLVIGLLTFPDGCFRPRWGRILAVFTVPVLLISAFFALSNGQSGALLASTLAGATLIALIAAIVTRYRATPPGTSRQQIKLAILGFVIGLLLVLVGAACQAMQAGAAGEGARAWWALIAALGSGWAISRSPAGCCSRCCAIGSTTPTRRSAGRSPMAR